MYVTNASRDRVAFRDDAGKHFLKPGEGIEVTGDQHLPMVLAVPGIKAGKAGRVVKADVAAASAGVKG